MRLILFEAFFASTPVEGTGNYRFESRTNMVILTHIGGLGSHDIQHILCENSSPSLSNTNWAHTRFIVNVYQASRHKCTLGCPEWAMIGQPVNIFHLHYCCSMWLGKIVLGRGVVNIVVSGCRYNY